MFLLKCSFVNKKLHKKCVLQKHALTLRNLNSNAEIKAPFNMTVSNISKRVENLNV